MDDFGAGDTERKDGIWSDSVMIAMMVALVMTMVMVKLLRVLMVMVATVML